MCEPGLAAHWKRLHGKVSILQGLDRGPVLEREDRLDKGCEQGISKAYGSVAELADAADSKSATQRVWGFESPRSY